MIKTCTGDFHCYVTKHVFHLFLFSVAGNNILGINGCDNLPEPKFIKYLLDRETPSGTVEKIDDRQYVVSESC